MWLGLVSAALACELNPGPGVGSKSPGDNHYRLIVNGEVERYAPDQRYVGEFYLEVSWIRFVAICTAELDH